MISTETRTQPTTLTSAFGRVFYAADNIVYFSQVLVDDLGVVGKCYQVNDPTSDHIPDLLATDGGEIPIEEAENILQLMPFRTGVLIFASNGVWYVYGSENGFSATAFNISKVSSYALASPRGAVAAGEIALFCSNSGVHQIVPNDFGTLTETSITDASIKTAFLEFVDGSVSASYDERNKQVWFINGGDKALVLDLRAGAWFPQEFSSGLHGQCIDLVRTGGGFYFTHVTGLQVNDMFLSQPTATNFKDYGVDTDAFLLSSYETLGEFSNKKGATYGSFFFNKTETEITGFDSGAQEYTFDYPSSCLLQTRWDFDGSNAYHKWTGDLKDGDSSQRGIVMQLYKPMQRGFIPDAYPYNFDTGETLVNKKVKLRGNGKAVQFMFKAEPEKDMQMLGYSIDYSMRGRK